MGDIVNLNKFRKKTARRQSEKNAKENRVVFGRTKQQKLADALAVQKDDAELDNKKRTDTKITTERSEE